jgi:hypothetical protein
MLKNVFNIPAQQQQKIAIIGAGAMGVSTACILAKLGIAQVTLFEAESKPFNSKGASINNTGILHHFVYGGHPKTLEHLFKQSILFRKLMPDHVFGDSYINYLVPNEEGNTALTQEGVTFKDVAVSLVDIYKRHLKNYPDENLWGQPEDLTEILDQDRIETLLGKTHSSRQEIAGAVRVRQSVLDIGKYACHMIKLLELVSGQQFLSINYHQKVNNIGINNRDFEIDINYSDQLCFDTVINAGYATGLEIPIPTMKDGQCGQGNQVKLKVYGIYKIPAALKLQMSELDKSFSSTILIRGQYGGMIRVASDLIAIFSGLEYNQAELSFPLDKGSLKIPVEWGQDLEKITGRTEKEIMASIKSDFSKWIPWAKELEDVKLKKAVQVYPGRKSANDLEAAQRDDNPIRYLYQHKNGGKYIHIPGFKLTSIPYHAFQVVLEILSTYILQEILTQSQVDKHIKIDSNSHIILSPEMECALGKDLPQLDINERKRIIKFWDIY